MGRRLSFISREYEPGDDGPVYARRAPGAPQSVCARTLPGGQLHPPRAVGQLLRYLGSACSRASAQGQRLMLATTFETDEAGHRLRLARLGSGPPLILLHGYPDNLQIWCELAPRLADRFTVIAFDWPGMGY